jgi:Domain of unknown function (DUF4190)
MAYPPGSAGDPGQEPNPAADPNSGAVEYPSIDYHPTPPPGYSLPPMPPPVPPSYLPPAVGAYPPPGPYPPPSPFPPPGGNWVPTSGYGPPPGYPAYPAPYAKPSATNGMAIGALVCSLVAFPAFLLCFGFALSVLGIVLGIIALNQVKQSHQKGKDLAIAAIALGGVGLLVGLIAVIYI